MLHLVVSNLRGVPPCMKNLLTSLTKNRSYGIRPARKEPLCKHFSTETNTPSTDMVLPENAITYDTPNFHFIIYGILHGQINEKRCSGKDASELLSKVKPNYLLLELCQQRLSKIMEILSTKEKKKDYHNNYSKFTYLPRIHNGFLQNEFLPIIQDSIKNKWKIFLLDRNINTIRNRLDSRLLYDTSAYRKFFTYCIESISLRHYSFEEFTKLYKHYDPSTATDKDTLHRGTPPNDTGDTPTKGVHEGELRMDTHNERKVRDNFASEAAQGVEPEQGRISTPQDADQNGESENWKKLKLLQTLNERLKVLSKPTYDILVEEKCKYMANNIWCFLLNNDEHFFDKKPVKKTIFVLCSANIVHKLVEEMDNVYLSLCKRYESNISSNSTEHLVFENPYTSYGTYVKPHWPFIFIKYYFIPSFILYVTLNTFYALTAWVYKSNFQRASSPSHRIIDIEV
ncbi:conserved Plasmodium protein, unknown function [Plasmodium knowlesi strain H]|uniref:Uncharacterized protein n=3 Tax=Plasmodium knowlesi TaxID=5850 RepID=A0A5K1VEA6_PLAKH|nr:conserved Plasmodium protein, unknown function [Plasmodium knowlesi strain H]OTN63936.1 Uncharacterized protein PKNOH_S140290100 [Plasmodium knowlesi]CAA9991311.1 conserved Plasmodium protein, unknown function [Plasmodium knowlesi strain H]SBO26420.1 conserved Plasmodium protein, unknown function [Plasmodium knowlesi strain H]SBO28982.1 conserved Plasmodium protein, unknown function [Plasmodium knowlesi strain H]VVS80785.1 conserved Plasmodium protein, unknown function [Plasmodium knowlesi |eukprot:XP_002262590.1 hypothetical protein, conserved in Plasmodium species [Plasmodium knowlesi strain H]